MVISDSSIFSNKFQKLDLPLIFAGVRLPKLEIDDKLRTKIGAAKEDSNEKIFRSLLNFNFKNKISKGIIKKEDRGKYIIRIKSELEVIEKLKFVDYFLILWDFINFARENNILIGKGRGSASGSLILFVLGITGIDPIRYNLLFERFISPSRSKYKEINGEIYLSGSLPDIDVDLDYLRRQEVIDYINNKYPNRTAKIVNLTTLTGKNLIKECGKIVYNKSESEMHQVSEMIPSIFGKIEDIEKTYSNNPKFKEWCDLNPKAYNIALNLRGLQKNKSVHASGLVISKDEITDISPIELTKDGEVTCSYNMADCGELMIKFDLLGLKTLSMLDEVCKLAGIKYEDINVEDPDIYKYLSYNPYFYGLFQIDGDTAYKATKLIKPDNIQHLAHIMALGRPGAMAFIKEYQQYKSKNEVKKIHPLIDDILEPTYGFLILQEQIMLICGRLGLSLEDGYALIKIIGKKLVDKVGEWEDRVKKAGQEKGLPLSVINLIWNTIKASADYSFNASHAFSYASLCAATTYAKIHYPKEYFLANLKIARVEAKPFECFSAIVGELPNFGIKLLPPNFSDANGDFTLCKEGIQFGLSAIKGISEITLNKLKNFDIKNANKFQMFEAAKRAGVDIGTLSALIQAGALQGFNEERSKLVLEAQLWNLLKPGEKEYCLEKGEENNFKLISMVKNINDWTQSDGKSVVRRKTRFDTIKKNYQKFKDIYSVNSKFESFANYCYEKNLLGFSYSTTLKEIFSKELPEIDNIKSFEEMGERSSGTFVGSLDQIVSAKTKNGKMYSRFNISDETGSICCFLFEPERSYLMDEKSLPKESDILTFKGQKSGDKLIIRDYQVQSNKVILSMADLKNFNEELNLHE